MTTAVLQELRLSPAEYIDRFAKPSNHKSETWTRFASRVDTQVRYYMKSIKDEGKEAVEVLIVSYCIRESLSAEGVEYVRARSIDVAETAGGNHRGNMILERYTKNIKEFPIIQSDS